LPSSLLSFLLSSYPLGRPVPPPQFNENRPLFLFPRRSRVAGDTFPPPSPPSWESKKGPSSFLPGVGGVSFLKGSESLGFPPSLPSLFPVEMEVVDPSSLPSLRDSKFFFLPLWMPYGTKGNIVLFILLFFLPPDMIMGNPFFSGVEV